GDLDSIVLKAMRKEPHERYNSAEQLSEDIRRHLKGLPVSARVGSFTYRAGKFFRRHKLALAVVTAFLLVISTSSVVSSILWRQAVRGQEQAETAFEFLKDMLMSVDPDQGKGESLTALEFLDRGREMVVEDLEDPELQIDVAGTLGEVFRKLGAYDESRELMEISFRIARLHYGGDHPEVAKRLGNLAVLIYYHQDYPQAERLSRGALEMRRRLGQQASKLFRIKGNLASTLMAQGKFEGAEELFLDILKTRLELYEPEYGPDDRDVATSRRNLGALYYDQGDLERAEWQLREALGIRRRVFGSEHTGVASVLNLLGNVLAAQGREDEAEQLYDETLRIYRRRLREEHPAVVRTKRDLAELLAHRDAATARVLLAQALATFYRTRPDGWEAADAESVLARS
ncbi:MAG: tetratricopeptide repeat protein, partial [bacterium]|nr:tetratricopeptide repeat protein [bacterium]